MPDAHHLRGVQGPSKVAATYLGKCGFGRGVGGGGNHSTCEARDGTTRVKSATPLWHATLYTKDTPCDKRPNTECQTPAGRRFEGNSQEYKVLRVPACA